MLKNRIEIFENFVTTMFVSPFLKHVGSLLDPFRAESGKLLETCVRTCNMFFAARAEGSVPLPVRKL